MLGEAVSVSLQLVGTEHHTTKMECTGYSGNFCCLFEQNFMRIRCCLLQTQFL